MSRPLYYSIGGLSMKIFILFLIVICNVKATDTITIYENGKECVYDKQLKEKHCREYTKKEIKKLDAPILPDQIEVFITIKKL